MFKILVIIVLCVLTYFITDSKIKKEMNKQLTKNINRIKESSKTIDGIKIMDNDNVLRNKQTLLSNFIKGFCDFLESYFSQDIKKINFKTNEKSTKLIITGFVESDYISIDTLGDEITIGCDPSGYFHWHIDDYSEPIKIESIYKQTTNDILSILNKEMRIYRLYDDINDELGVNGCCDTIPLKTFVKDWKRSFKNGKILKIKEWGNEQKIYRIHKILNYVYLESITI